MQHAKYFRLVADQADNVENAGTDRIAPQEWQVLITQDTANVTDHDV